MDVPNWQVAFFHLVDLGTQVPFSGSTLMNDFIFFFSQREEGKKERSTFTLKNLSSEMTYSTSTHVSSVENLVLCPCKGCNAAKEAAGVVEPFV